MEHLLALTAFAFVTTVTPGPNNMMLMSSGANFGLRRTLPHLGGIMLGVAVMVMVLGSGVAIALHQAPRAETALRIAAMGYILWLAWKIAHSAAPDGSKGRARPLNLLEAALFQWLNPKAWAMALGALGAYAAAVGGVPVVAAIFAAVGPVAMIPWIVAGQKIGRFLTSPRRLRLFNWTMAGLLVASMLPVLFL
ncbi:MAG: LysE family translocator [Paracoccus sp. (in: a-proteobacteria)]|nr:LysE family translocator [Paracoccus sp. (in: a-proteobacteria)]